LGTRGAPLVVTREIEGVVVHNGLGVPDAHRQRRGLRETF
jgi:hypothetical protein